MPFYKYSVWMKGSNCLITFRCIEIVLSCIEIVLSCIELYWVVLKLYSSILNMHWYILTSIELYWVVLSYIDLYWLVLYFSFTHNLQTHRTIKGESFAHVCRNFPPCQFLTSTDILSLSGSRLCGLILLQFTWQVRTCYVFVRPSHHDPIGS